MQEIRRVLKAAAWRLWVVDAFRTGVVTATAALLALVLLRLGEKLLPISVDWSMVAVVGPGLVLTLALLWAWIRLPRGPALARQVDERAGLRESLSTALAVAGNEDGWSKLVVESACQHARRVVVRDAVPLETPRFWQAPLVLGLLLAGVWWLPRFDVTGLWARKQSQEQARQQVQQVMAEIRVDQDKLEELLRKAGLQPEAENDPSPAEPQSPDPKQVDEIRREVLRNLTNLSEQIKARQESDEAKALQALENQLRRLRTPGNGPLTEFSRSLARGNFAEAKNRLEELAEQLASNRLSESDRAKAREQLESLKQQLDRLAENKEQLEQALREAGLPKAQAQQLAQASTDPQALQQALEKMEGLTEPQKQQLRQLAQAQSQACQSCSGMAGALGQLAQAMNGSPDQAAQGLSSMSAQLSQLELAQQELANLQAAASECRSQIDKLGQSMCAGGQGQCFGQSPWAQGLTSALSAGSGGPGQGSGGTMESEATDFTLERIRQPVANTGGPIIGETIVYGSQLRGQSKAGFREAVAAARIEAAHALEQKAIPKQYQALVAYYFGPGMDAIMQAAPDEAPAEGTDDSGK